jgi:uncharacterized membrane protein YhaH (DUF805 family)
MGCFVEGLKNYVRFKGRATRTQFWFYVLWFYVFLAAAILLDNLTANLTTFNDKGVLTGIYYLATIIPNLTILIRRLHDIGKSGLLILLNIIPVIGSIVLLILACIGSDPGLNKYGPPVYQAMPAHPAEAAGDPAGTEYIRSEENYKI